MYPPTVIEQALGSNLRVIQTHMRRFTLAELCKQFDSSEKTVRSWEKRYDARARRGCDSCRGTFDYSEMAQNTRGKMLYTNQCKPCHAAKVKKGRKSVHAYRVEMEYLAVSDSVYAMTRQKIGKDSGGRLNYWMQAHDSHDAGGSQVLAVPAESQAA